MKKDKIAGFTENNKTGGMKVMQLTSAKRPSVPISTIYVFITLFTVAICLLFLCEDISFIFVIG